MMVSGLLPGMGATVGSLPGAVPGGASLVMFRMAAATGALIRGSVDFGSNRYNGLVVAIHSGIRMFLQIAADFRVWRSFAIYPLINSGFRLASLTAVGLIIFVHGSGSADGADARDAALASKGSH